MELLQVQEELNIVLRIMQQQLDLVEELQDIWRPSDDGDADQQSVKYRRRSFASSTYSPVQAPLNLPQPLRATYRQLSNIRPQDPMSQLLESLRRELMDLQDLRDNSDRLVNRTIQLVNIRLEDHGKAILVFTIVTIIFLPLSFVSSFFGMNVSDIRNLDRNQGLFWIVACTVTAGVVGLSIFLAFYGGAIMERFLTYKESQRMPVGRSKPDGSRKMNDQKPGNGMTNFQVLDIARVQDV